MNTSVYLDVVTRYLARLEAGDVAGMAALLSADGRVYHWQLKDGTFVDFNCADVFDFDEQGRITCMTIVYDTHPVRAQVGNKYG